jgi:hypothetical protein
MNIYLVCIVTNMFLTIFGLMNEIIFLDALHYGTSWVGFLYEGIDRSFG